MTLFTAPVDKPALNLKATAHTLTPSAYSIQLLALLMAGAETPFEKLTPGLWFYKGHSTDYHRIVRVESVSPSGRKASLAVLRKLVPVEATDAFRGSWNGPFFPVSVDLLHLALGDCIHENLVAAADKASVPASVRRYYPQHFVEIPAAFAELKRGGVAETLTGWREATTADDVRKCIASTHASIAAHDLSAAMTIVRGHESQVESDKARASLLSRIDFFLWLLPKVDVGGEFHLAQIAE